MIPFKVHTLETAPEGSRDAMRAVHTNLGFVPNLAAAMAEFRRRDRRFGGASSRAA